METNGHGGILELFEFALHTVSIPKKIQMAFGAKTIYAHIY